MATFRGSGLFGSGPTRIVPADATERVKVSRFPGLVGEHHLRMGRDGALITQTGTLIGTSASNLKTQINDLRAQAGERGTLVDDFGFTYADCLMTDLRFDGPRRKDADGRIHQDYTITYKQAVSSIG
jgi:hypothetical protein